MKTLTLISILALAGCHVPNTAQRATAPVASTAQTGVSLDSLGKSLGSAQRNASATSGKLSEIDAKAVRIEDSLRNW